MVQHSARKSWIKAIIWMLIQRNHLPQHACTSSTGAPPPPWLCSHSRTSCAATSHSGLRSCWRNVKKGLVLLKKTLTLLIHTVLRHMKWKNPTSILYCSHNQLESTIKADCGADQCSLPPGWGIERHNKIPLWGWHKTVGVATWTVSKANPPVSSLVSRAGSAGMVPFVLLGRSLYALFLLSASGTLLQTQHPCTQVFVLVKTRWCCWKEDGVFQVEVDGVMDTFKTGTDEWCRLDRGASLPSLYHLFDTVAHLTQNQLFPASCFVHLRQPNPS